jgi:hypothetical protein
MYKESLLNVRSVLLCTDSLCDFSRRKNTLIKHKIFYAFSAEMLKRKVTEHHVL